MPIHGTIEEAGLPDVLQLLALGRKTGCLAVEDGTTHGEIYLEAGRVSFASVSNRLDRLGEMLVKAGRITRQQLTDAAAEQSRRSSKRQLGRILVDSGHIERPELERYVKMQVEEAIYLLFTWKKGTFSFKTDRRPPSQPLLVSLDCENLLLEGARRVDEWSQIEKKIPSFDLVYRRGKPRTGAGADLSEDQKRILPLLDGTRDVNGIVEAAGMSEFDAGKALYGLILAGFAQMVERRTEVRHLDFRELLAYVVREAEYADPERRRHAGRHIVDCPSCSARLRTIHVRRTTGTVPPSGITEEIPFGQLATAATRPIPAAVGPGPKSPGGPPVPFLERRLRDRRTGVDRRRVERRASHDRRLAERRSLLERRHTVDAAWADKHEERRVAQRRSGDRRRGVRVERRSGSGERRVAAAATAATRAAPRATPGGPRRTEPRYAPTVEPAGVRTAAAMKRDTVGDTVELVPIALEAERMPEAEAPETPDAAPTAAEEPRTPPVAARRDDRSTKELVWLTSPEESVEMIRASRSSVSPVGGTSAAGSPSAAAPLPPPPPPSPPPVAAQAPPAPPPAASTSQTIPAPAMPWPPPAAPPAPVVARTESRRPPSPSAPGGVVRLEVSARTLRRAAMAAGIGAVALLGYLAGQVGRGGTASDARQETVAAPVSPPQPAESTPVEVAQQPPPAVLPGVQTANAQPVPGRVPAPAAQRPPESQPARPQPVSAPAPQRPAASEPAAQPPPERAPPPAAEPAAPAPQPAAAAPETPAPAPRPAPTAAEPDRELATGGWNRVSRADAAAALGGTLGAIQGLSIESVSQSTTGSRTRIRVTQLTDAGVRIVLTETRAGAAVRSPGPVSITALRVLPPSEAFPYSTGTASLGNILVSARSSLPADDLRALLQRLGDASP